jgi:hypothetical protein
VAAEQGTFPRCSTKGGTSDGRFHRPPMEPRWSSSAPSTAPSNQIDEHVAVLTCSAMSESTFARPPRPQHRATTGHRAGSPRL